MLQHDHSTKIFTISNMLTLSRIVLTPFIVVSLLRQAWGITLIFFCLAGLSDLLDGFVARLLNEPTWLGSVLDPIADKILIISSLYAFFLSSPNILLPSWFVWVIAVRETVLLVGGIVLFFSHSSLQVQPSWLGKATTFLVLSLMILVLVCAALNYKLVLLINGLVYLVLGCSIVSFGQYSCTAARFFFKN
jgi:cardiolipin synthase